jgi:osmotically-inducible protein OsmY
MKLNIATAGLMAGALLVPYAVTAQQQDSAAPQPEPAAQVQSSDNSHHPIKDSDITTKVKAKLAAHHLTSLGRIHVDTDGNGAVHLSGTAHSQEAIDQAVSIAKGTEHVTSVTNDLRIKADD